MSQGIHPDLIVKALRPCVIERALSVGLLNDSDLPVSAGKNALEDRHVRLMPVVFLSSCGSASRASLVVYDAGLSEKLLFCVLICAHWKRGKWLRNEE